MSIRHVIADQIHDVDWDTYVDPKDIRNVEFRKGCAEIEVGYVHTYDDLTTDTRYVTIDAAPVLSQLLQWALALEVTHSGS
jgi:hypothetical protein